MSLKIDRELKEELKETYLWRYMSLDKFIDLIKTQSIYFATNTQLITGDPYEGALFFFTNVLFCLDSDYQNKKVEYNNLAKPLVQWLEDTKTLNISSKISNIRNNTFINCWHINEDENYLMWQSYAHKKGDIAIVSDIESLIEAIETDIDIEAIKVNYSSKDFNKEMSSITNINYGRDNDLKNLIKISSKYKKEPFKNENELRLIFQLDNNNNFNQKIKVNLDKLIKYIYVSPSSSNTEKQTIINLLKPLIQQNKINSNIINEVYTSLISNTYITEINEFNTDIAIAGKFGIEKTDNEDEQKRLLYMIFSLIFDQDTPPHKRERERRKIEALTKNQLSHKQ